MHARVCALTVDVKGAARKGRLTTDKTLDRNCCVANKSNTPRCGEVAEDVKKHCVFFLEFCSACCDPAAPSVKSTRVADRTDQPSEFDSVYLKKINPVKH